VNKPLVDKIALITGASRGLGAQIAQKLARDGAQVVLIARDKAALKAVAAQIRAEHASQKVKVYPTDLASIARVDRLFERVTRDVGPIDILVNNAAVQGPIGSFDRQDWKQWKSVIDVNLMAPARLSQLAIPQMRAKGWGKIVNVAGGGATSARPDFSAYAASKCALVRLTETLAEELRSAGIDVNAVAPGAMNTRMLEEVLAAGPNAAPHEYEAAVKRSREGGESPDRAAALVAWLVSPASDGISGKLISASWDDWQTLGQRKLELAGSELYTLRRVV
jgi:NAD(P)-dependent dehydrogenase (short-subunit alcohol dehydrogenase family)